MTRKEYWWIISYPKLNLSVICLSKKALYLKLVFANDSKSSNGLITDGVISADSKDPLYESHMIFPINKAVMMINLGASMLSFGNELKLPDPKLVWIVITIILMQSFRSIWEEPWIFNTPIMHKATAKDDIIITIHNQFLNGLINTLKSMPSRIEVFLTNIPPCPGAKGCK